MDHVIAALPPGSRVLDASAPGTGLSSPRHDIEIVRLAPGKSVAAMRFEWETFDLAVVGLGLDAAFDLEDATREIGRVLKADGGLYLTVAESGTLTDRIFRWLSGRAAPAKVFRSPGDVVVPVERLTGLKCSGTRVLFSGLSFLNARNITHRPKRLLLFANGNERFLAFLTWMMRTSDLLFGTRASHYGWEFYFGSAEPVDSAEWWSNVCVRCGAGHSEVFLRQRTGVRRTLHFWESYRCPECSGWNLLTRD